MKIRKQKKKLKRLLVFSAATIQYCRAHELMTTRNDCTPPFEPIPVNTTLETIFQGLIPPQSYDGRGVPIITIRVFQGGAINRQEDALRLAVKAYNRKLGQPYTLHYVSISVNCIRNKFECGVPAPGQRASDKHTTACKHPMTMPGGNLWYEPHFLITWLLGSDIHFIPCQVIHFIPAAITTFLVYLSLSLSLITYND